MIGQIAEGKLTPSDDVPGLTFTIQEVGEDRYRIILVSPHAHKDIVDSTTCSAAGIGPYLVTHVDW